MKKLFLAGIMQGSRLDNAIHNQGYRKTIREALWQRYPDVELFCPYEMNPNSVDYDDEKGKRTFLDSVRAAVESDGVIAYVPEASMGTAIEMWEAYRAGKPIWVISPLMTNWVIRFFSTRVFRDLDEFVAFVAAGGLDSAVRG